MKRNAEKMRGFVTYSSRAWVISS